MGSIFSGPSPSSPPPPTPAPLLEPVKDPKRAVAYGTSRDEARRRAILAAGSRRPTGAMGLAQPAQVSGKKLLGGVR